MENIILAIVLILISVACFIISYLQFKERGFLFNNAYIYASEKEREMMNKKPYYRQSGIVLAMVGIMFLLNALYAILEMIWLVYLVIAIAVAAVVYGIVSSIILGKKER